MLGHLFILNKALRAWSARYFPVSVVSDFLSEEKNTHRYLYCVIISKVSFPKKENPKVQSFKENVGGAILVCV